MNLYPARVVNGEPVAYPYSLRPDARRAHPEISPVPGSWDQCSPEQLAAFEAVPVQPTTPPELQPGESLREVMPAFVDGVLLQQWEVIPAPPPAVPERVEAHKLLAELSARNLRASVEALVAQSPQEVQDAFNRAPYMHRTSQMLNDAARALGVSQNELDEIFIAAAARST